MTFFRFAVSCGFRNVFTTLNVRVSVSIIDQQQQQQQHKLYLHDYNYVVTVLQKL